MRQGSSKVAHICIPEIVDPARAHESLEAHHARIEQSCELRLIFRIRGDESTPERNIDVQLPLARARETRERRSRAVNDWGATFVAASLSANVSFVVVVGKLFSGISTTVVTPPAAAPRVPVRKPSQSEL